jgi:hypothetical protein
LTYGKPLAGVCGATALFVCGVTGFPVPPNSLPASEGTLALGSGSSSNTTFAPGAKVTLSGSGFKSNAAVTLVMYSEPQQLGTTVADAGGAISSAVSIPRNVTGTHTLVALGVAPDGTAHNVQSKINVVAGGGPGELAMTGVNVAAMVAGGLGMIIGGFVLVRTARYRRPLLPAN